LKLASGLIGLGLFAATLAPVRAQVVLGQLDTFEDGTTTGWRVGDPTHPAPPTNIPTGGPAGVGDNYLQLTALGGGGPASKLSAFNVAQWAGNYIAAGVTFITLNARNTGPDDLFLRLLFADPVAGPPSNVAITDSVFLPAGGGWTYAVFAVDPGSLITVLGDATTALTNATELRIFHNPAPTFPGPPNGIPPVTAVLGVDNILAANRALVVPEPSSVSALFLGLGFAGFLVRRRVQTLKRA
jgi:hypothetical protein